VQAKRKPFPSFYDAGEREKRGRINQEGDEGLFRIEAVEVTLPGAK
jgi:hypothetical protein